MLIKDLDCLENILKSVEKIESYFSQFKNAEEVWQIIHNKLPKLKIVIKNYLE